MRMKMSRYNTWGSIFSQLAEEKSAENKYNLFADAACFDIL